MRALVIGGAGYIGSVVARHLVDAGHHVTVADNLSKGHRWAVPDEAEFREVDVRDHAALTSVVGEGFDAVLHFAALSLVGESITEPVRYFKTNVGGSLNLLAAMREGGCRRLVFASTAAVYGEPETIPIPESAPTRPTNPYGASKIAVDMAIGYEAAATGLGAVSLRYFNVAGASGRQGELHDPETHLIPSVLKVALGEGDVVRIFGTDYPTADGTAVRDYIHVDDLARAHLLALEGRPPNIENRGEVTIRDLVRNALRMRPDRIIVGEVRGGEALDMLQAMNTGHEGSMSTLHANTPRDAVSRLETMVLMAGIELPSRAIREQIASAINLIVHLSRLRDGTRRVTHLTEVTGMESGVITLQDIFTLDHSSDIGEDGLIHASLVPTGIRPAFAERLKAEGLPIPARLLGSADPIRSLRSR
ncbi:MAG: UDP-glucose 4-epimerase GalE [Acidimicrobiales bacterium]